MYRRDEIDCSHYPVFHQMEGVRIIRRGDPAWPADVTAAQAKQVGRTQVLL